MRVLILGIKGMVGREFWRQFKEDKRFDVFGTCRIDLNNSIFSFDAQDNDRLHEIIDIVKPEIIVNCIGIIKSYISTTPTSEVIYINSVFPHILAEACSDRDIKLIHISTDCVFDGQKADYYTIMDETNAKDLYGRTKALGEVLSPHITIRTSFIGHTPKKTGLLEWVLSQKNKQIIGYENHFWNGITTVWFSKFLREFLLDLKSGILKTSGIMQLGVQSITKYELLCLINDIYQLNCQITPQLHTFTSRLLKSNIVIPKHLQLTHKKMIEEMYETYKKCK